MPERAPIAHCRDARDRKGGRCAVEGRDQADADIVEDLSDEELSELLERICRRPLDHAAFPYVHIDITRERAGGRWHDVVTATGVREDLGFEPLGMAAAGRGEGDFWRRFVCALLLRGLHGVAVVASPGDPGLVRAVREFLPTVRWQPGPPLELVPREDIAVLVATAEDRPWHATGPNRGRSGARKGARAGTGAAGPEAQPVFGRRCPGGGA